MHLALPTTPRRQWRWWSPLLGLLWACAAAAAATTTTTTAAAQNDEGAQPPPPPPPLPKNFGVLIHRAFEVLDVFGPLSALGLLSSLHQMNLYMISETMDPVTVEPVLPAMNFKNSSFYPVVLPTHTYATVPEDIEVLIVPGGMWTRLPDLGPTVAYVRDTYPRLRYLVSICTGAGVIARAGVLDGRRATTNKLAWRSIVALGPRTEWVARARWVVDGNVWTSSGVSAGIDATLAFIEEVYGAAEAKTIADKMEYDRHLDPSWDPFADIFNVTGARAAGAGSRRDL